MMRVLQLCHRIPFPPSDGGSIAMHQITRGLIDNGHEVKVIALAPNTVKADVARISSDYLRETGFEAVPADTRIKLLPAFLNLFSGRSYNVERFSGRAMERKLEEVLKKQNFDIIQLEGLYLTPYISLIRRLSNAPLVYRAHNIEHFIWKRLASACRTPLKKQYLKLLAGRLKKYEMQVIHEVDGLAAISPVDQAFFRNHGFSGPSVVIPVGIPDQKIPDPLPEAEAGSVFHLGSMDWRPNQEGLKWFLREVWPLVIRRCPQLKFYLAGKRMPASFNQYASDNVVVVGEVPNAMNFVCSKQLMVVPLLSGGGMRVKIIEGMAAGKPIVSTHIGAEGIGCEHGKHIFLADSPEQMAYWITRCFNHPAAAARTGTLAREFAINHFRTEQIIRDLIKFYQEF